MGRTLCHHEGYFFEWSSVVDAPVTKGMDRAAFDEYQQWRYGQDYMEREYPQRIERTLATGTSQMNGEDLRSFLSFNRAGWHESQLTFEQIIQIFCVEYREPVEGEGVPHNLDGD